MNQPVHTDRINYLIHEIRLNLHELVEEHDVTWAAFECYEEDFDHPFYETTGITFSFGDGVLDVILDDEV